MQPQSLRATKTQITFGFHLRLLFLLQIAVIVDSLNGRNMFCYRFCMAATYAVISLAQHAGNCSRFRQAGYCEGTASKLYIIYIFTRRPHSFIGLFLFSLSSLVVAVLPTVFRLYQYSSDNDAFVGVAAQAAAALAAGHPATRARLIEAGVRDMMEMWSIENYCYPRNVNIELAIVELNSRTCHR